MKKRKTVRGFGVVIMLMILAGCGGKEQTDETAKKPLPDQIAISGYGMADTEISYGSITDLKNDAEAIIYGEVKNYRYETDNGVTSTIETIEVLDSLEGNIEEGTTIEVFKTGGYVLLQDYIDSFDEESREQVRNMVMFQTYTDEEMKEKYMSQIPDGEVDSDIGDKSVLFLRYGKIKEGLYNRVGAWEGEYVEVEDGRFKVPGLGSYDEMNNLSAEEGENGESPVNDFISWDELVQEINS